MNMFRIGLRLTAAVFFIVILTSPTLANYSPLVFPEDSPLGFFQNFDSIYIGVYTFTSEEIGSVIQDRNAILLVEKSPVGGIPDRELLCSLEIPVYLYSGEKRYMHAKYAVKDNSSFFISTENFGGFSNRGWGLVSKNERGTEKLVNMFFTDLEQSVRLDCTNNEKRELRQAKISSLPDFVTGNTIIFTDNYLENLLELIRGVETLHIQQFYFHKQWSNGISPLIPELVGKDVKVLLDGEWYNVEKNNETVEYLRKLGIQAKLEDTDLKIHNKGMIADNKALISSINWNENSITRNREVGVIVEGDVSKFKESFEKDWKENLIEQTTGLLGNAVIFICVVLGAWVLARR